MRACDARTSSMPINGIEDDAGGEAVQREFGFGLGASGEDGEAEIAR